MPGNLTHQKQYNWYILHGWNVDYKKWLTTVDTFKDPIIVLFQVHIQIMEPRPWNRYAKSIGLSTAHLYLIEMGFLTSLQIQKFGGETENMLLRILTGLSVMFILENQNSLIMGIGKQNIDHASNGLLLIRCGCLSFFIVTTMYIPPWSPAMTSSIPIVS